MSLQPEGALGFMPFYYQRFAWSTRGWPADAAMAYLFLLCEQYSNGGLNPDPQVLEEIAPGTVAHWDRIKRKFTQGPDGLLRNIRCEEIRSRSLAAGDRKRQQARNAAAMRWHSGSNAGAMRNDANDNDNESDTDSEIGNESESGQTHSLGVAEPASDNRKRKLPIPDGALERLWNLFPRKVGKGRAMKLLEQAIRAYADEWELPEMDSAVEVFREHIARMAEQYRNKEQQYIPHPATWLSQQRYLDPVPEAR
jgi:uncharacterized protein YdaU (DUF1376 family)